MKTTTIYIIFTDVDEMPVCSFESKQSAINFCKKQEGFHWSPISLHHSDWMPLQKREDFEKMPKDRDFLCLFDDGTICNFKSDHPAAIMTHFKELS